MLKPEQVLDSYFPEVRAWLIQIAAVMDRYDRAAEQGRPAVDDARLRRFAASLEVLANSTTADRAQRIQRIFADPID